MSSETVQVQTAKFPWPESNGVWATYNLHCHCGTVRYTMRISPPLYKEHTEGKEQYTGVECECSVCERNGYQMVHPLAENVEFTQGAEELNHYYFANKMCPHLFCRKCGSSLGADLSALFKGTPAPARYAMNLRMLKDYDRSKLSLTQSSAMKEMGPKYEI